MRGLVGLISFDPPCELSKAVASNRRPLGSFPALEPVANRQLLRFLVGRLDLENAHGSFTSLEGECIGTLRQVIIDHHRAHAGFSLRRPLQDFTDLFDGQFIERLRHDASLDQIDSDEGDQRLRAGPFLDCRRVCCPGHMAEDVDSLITKPLLLPDPLVEKIV